MNIVKVLPLHEYEELIKIRNKKLEKNKLVIEKKIVNCLKLKTKKEQKVLEILLQIPSLTCTDQNGNSYSGVEFSKKITKKFIKLLAKNKYKEVNNIKNETFLLEAFKDMKANSKR